MSKELEFKKGIMEKIGDLKCSNCKRQLWIDVHEVDSETNIPTPHGFHVACDEDYPFYDTCDRTYEDKEVEHEIVYKYIINNKISVSL